MKSSSADPQERRQLWRDGIFLFGVCVVLFFARLGGTPLWDDDETRFACIARDMLHSGDWIVPRDNGGLANKPAAFFWSMAVSFRLLGETPLAARIFSAICGVLSVLVSWRTTLLLAGRGTAFWSSFALATSLLFVVEARAATMDMGLFLALSCAMYVPVAAWWKNGRYLPGPLSRREAAMAGVCAGAGLMIKGLVAVALPLLVLFLFVFFAGDRSLRWTNRATVALRVLRPFVFASAVLVVALPWHLAVGWETDWQWLQIFYADHHFGRISRVMEGHGGFPMLQVPMLFAGLFPWSVFLPLALWRCCRAAFGPQQEPSAVLAAVWLLTWVILFGFSATQLPNYILPAYPAACFMIGTLCVGAMRHPEETSSAWLYTAAGGLLAGGLAIGSVILGFAQLHALHGLQRFALVALVPAMSAFLFCVAVRRHHRRPAFVIFAAGAVVLLTVLFLRVAPAIASCEPLPSLVAAAGRDKSQRPAWATYRFSAPSVGWLSGGHVKECRNAEELCGYLRDTPGAVALINAKAAPEIEAVLGRNPVPICTARPLLRSHEVWLIDAQSLGLPTGSSALEVP